jgi:hypothetical protein
MGILLGLIIGFAASFAVRHYISRKRRREINRRFGRIGR